MNFLTSPLCLLLLLTITTRIEAPCPLKSNIHPCTCWKGNDDGVIIECAGMDNIWDLVLAIKYLKPHPGFAGTTVSTFTISNSTMSYLKEDLFEDLAIRKMYLKKSTFVSLSNGPTAFKGLENSLELLSMKGCTFMNSWKWSQLKNLKRLKRFDIYGGDLLAINEDIDALSQSSIVGVYFDKNYISWIHKRAFSNFSNLQTLSISDNEIEKLRRSMFPKPAHKLGTLDLSHNNIQSLPKDMFSDMPALTEVFLGDNKLSVLQEEVFSPIWNQLTMFAALDNPISCDCRMIWITATKQNEDSHMVKCNQPDRLKGKSIVTLIKSELWC